MEHRIDDSQARRAPVMAPQRQGVSSTSYNFTVFSRENANCALRAEVMHRSRANDVLKQTCLEGRWSRRTNALLFPYWPNYATSQEMIAFPRKFYRSSLPIPAPANTTNGNSYKSVSLYLYGARRKVPTCVMLTMASPK